ncbi:16S rRNA (uracil(1498)-N(3))-methyltransferase [Microbacterium aureliae]
MALHFVADDASSVAAGGTIVLTGAEAHHAAVVRRVRVGEEVTVGDGRGTWLTGVCAEVSPREVSVRVSTRRDVPAAAPRVVLVQALAKGDRDELAVQAATELGVDEILPWQAARSVSRWEGPKAQKGRDRWTSIVREAAKQAHRAWVPDVAAPVTTAELAERARRSRMLVLDPAADRPLSAVLREAPEQGEIVLVVGPEGGITEQERERLVEAGATAVRLGDTVLRTSTAGPAALAVVGVVLGRW